MGLNTIKKWLRMLLAARARNGPYRFLVRRWDDLSDIDLCRNVASLEFFSKELTALEAPLDQFDRYLVVAPHADDELMGAGGTLVKARRLGKQLTVVFATDSVIQAELDRDGYADLRRGEALNVCRQLGASARFLGIDNVDPVLVADHVQELARIIETTESQVMLVPWLLDPPAKHRMTNHLTMLALRLASHRPAEVWCYQVHATLIPNLLVDITDCIDEKTDLIRLYQSQVELQRYDHLARGAAAWNSRYMKPSSKGRFAEVFFGLPRAEYIDMVARLYSSDYRRTFQNMDRLADSIKALDLSR